MLIQLGKNEIVDSSHILWAKRMGNYTNIKLKDGSLFQQIWDEDEELWYQIKKAVSTSKRFGLTGDPAPMVLDTFYT